MTGVESTQLGAARLRGRRGEEQQIADQLDALAGGRGGVILIRGNVGVGKSALLDEAENMARRLGIEVFQGTADAATQAVPLGPLLDALVYTDDPPVDPEALLELSRSPDQRFWLLRELQERLEQAALRRPMVIALDHLHWADAATLTAISTLPRHLASHRILWLLAVRSGRLSTPVQAAVNRLETTGALTLTLDNLDNAAVAEIAQDLLGGLPDSQFSEALEGVNGQPFLVVEVLSGLRDEELVEVDEGVARLKGTHIPRRFLDSTGEYLQRLSGDARDAVQMASVLGRRFSVEELASMMERSPVALLGPLRETIAIRFLVEEGDRLGFRHDLVREAIDARLPDAIRRSLQRRAIDVMIEHGAPPSDVAMLVTKVARPGDQTAIELLRRAAVEVGRVSPSVAAPLSRRALELTPPGDPTRGARVVETLDFLVLAGEAAEADQLLADNSEDLVDPGEEARARLNIGLLVIQYLPSASVEQCQRALQLPDLPPASQVRFLSLMSRSYELLGDLPGAEAPAREGARIARDTGDPLDEVLSLVPRALIAFAHGHWREAIDLAGDAVVRADRTDAPASRLWLCDAWKTQILLSVGRLQEALSVIDAGTRAAEEEGVSANLRIWSMLRARVLFSSGRLSDAQAEAETTLELSDEFGTEGRGYINHIASYVLACVALHTGSPAGLRDARAAAKRMRDAQECLASQRLGAWLSARLVDIDGEAFPTDSLDAEMLDPLASGSLHASSPRGHADAAQLVRMLLQAGNRRDARKVVQRLERAVALQSDFPFIQAASAHARAVLDADAELAVTAAELYRDDLRPLVRASALEDAGRLLGPARQADAVTHLDGALLLYSTAGAERDLARVRRLLRKRGVRRTSGRPRSSSEWPDLTSSEFAVVRLVARGATNREVADRLFLSPYTVNSHLRHVFAKLGIRSRVELARLAAERGLTGEEEQDAVQP
jgi:DNA-binding CsgD family transcriptional regulator